MLFNPMQNNSVSESLNTGRAFIKSLIAEINLGEESECHSRSPGSSNQDVA